METAKDLIERVAGGEDAFAVVKGMDEAKKGGPTIHIRGKDIKPQGKYDTPQKAARAVAAWIIRDKYGDAKVNKMAAKGLKGKKKKK
jgi:hypothetical protein